MNNMPIGLFDSGVGGLTVLRAMRARMPGESYVFLGDTARLPYGTKSRETITRYALQCSAKLVERGIKVLVVACNTVSSVALPALREAWPHLPVVGVVEPGAQAACLASACGHIAVIATEATIRDKAYDEAILRLRPEVKVEGKACPLLVPLAEDGLVEGPLVEGIVARYIAEMFNAARPQGLPDTLVLACTHFPLLAGAIAAVAGPQVKLVDSAQTTAVTVERMLALGGAASENKKGDTLFLTTDDTARFAAMGERFLGIALPRERVELVDL